jgi:hypothetical protein
MTILLLITLNNLLMIIYVFKKHETMKIVEFFLIIWGKWSELEPEPELEPNKNGPAPQH